jgi:hypothetical protein
MSNGIEAFIVMIHVVYRKECTKCLYTPPSINLQIHPRNKLGFRRRHKHTRRCNIVDLSDPTHGHITRELRPVLRCIFHSRERTEQPRRSNERADGHNADLVWSIFGRKTFRGVPYSTFARIVPHQPRPWPRCAYTSNVDNDAAFPALKRLGDPRIASQIHALDVDIKRPLKLLLCDILRGLVSVAPPGIIHEDIAAAEFLGTSCYSGFPVRAFGDIHFVEGE